MRPTATIWKLSFRDTVCRIIHISVSNVLGISKSCSSTPLSNYRWPYFIFITLLIILKARRERGKLEIITRFGDRLVCGVSSGGVRDLVGGIVWCSGHFLYGKPGGLCVSCQFMVGFIYFMLENKTCFALRWIFIHKIRYCCRGVKSEILACSKTTFYFPLQKFRSAFIKTPYIHSSLVK